MNSDPSGKFRLLRPDDVAACFRVLLACMVCISLAGCFVRWPAHGFPADRKHVGATVPTTRTVGIYTQWFGNTPIDPGTEWTNVGSAQHKIADLPKGSLVKVRGIVYSSTPWDRSVPYYFVCEALHQKVTFDVLRDSTLLDWSGSTNESPNERDQVSIGRQ